MYVPVHFVPMLLFKFQRLIKVSTCIGVCTLVCYFNAYEYHPEKKKRISVQDPISLILATAKSTLFSCMFLSSYVFFVKVLPSNRKLSLYFQSCSQSRQHAHSNTDFHCYRAHWSRTKTHVEHQTRGYRPNHIWPQSAHEPELEFNHNPTFVTEYGVLFAKLPTVGCPVVRAPRDAYSV